MSDAALRELAGAAGIEVHWRNWRGEAQEVPPDTLRAVLTALELPCDSPEQVRESRAQLGHEALPDAVAAPSRKTPLHGRRLWGLAAQVYSLRHAQDGGFGDFTALANLARSVGAAGAQALAISPLHALFAADLARYSPYAPSSRLMLNAMHVDPAALAGPEFSQALSKRLGLEAEFAVLRELELIDWPRAMRAKLELLRALFRAHNVWADDEAMARLAAFRRERGEALESHARFEALQAHQLGSGGAWNWRDWPAGLRDPASPAVREFAREHAEDVAFHVFLQWLADEGLAQAHAAAKEAGMPVGLIADLAVGTDGGGSHAWSRPHDLLQGVTIGAPPDLLNSKGQDWGLTTFSPRALQSHDQAPLREMLRAALRHAGGVRIDHVLGLNRMWLVPRGAKPHEGAYLKYPLHGMLAAVAEEAAARSAVVVGEDLGTVPEGFGETLSRAAVLGMRVLWFERQHGYFVEPSRWPAPVMATTSTHDLPTVAGWWEGRDLDWHERLATSDGAMARTDRARDREALAAAFAHAGLGRPQDAEAAVDAALRFVARTPSQLMLLPLEDLLGCVEQPNLPGTIDEHPNWRHRLPHAADVLLESARVRARLAALREERPA